MHRGRQDVRIVAIHFHFQLLICARRRPFLRGNVLTHELPLRRRRRLRLRLVLFRLLLLVKTRASCNSWEPSRKLPELIDGRLGLFDEPIDGFTGSVIAQSVLHIVELNCGVGGEADAAVPGAFGGADLAMAVLSANRP